MFQHELKNAYIGERNPFMDYQEVEYIQSTATNPWTASSSWQVIDTWFIATPNTEISIDLQFTSVSAKQQRLFWVETENSSYMTFVAYINWSGQWARAVKDGSWNWQTTNVSADTNRHTFVLNNSSYKIYTNGTITHNWANAYTATKSTQHSLILLATWSEYYSSTIIEHSSAKLYSCKIYESWTLVRDFVPCYRKSDSVIWMWDKVNNNFYPNTGSWTFTKWPDVN